jgi:amidase
VLKPTGGLIGNDGAIPISARQDIIGTLTRIVKGAAHLLNHMAGRSDRDERTLDIPFEHMPGFTTFCKGKDLSNITIGVLRNTVKADSTSPIMVSFEAALEILRAADASVIYNADFPEAEGFKRLNQQVKGTARASKFHRDMVRYLDTVKENPNKIRSVEDIIEFTKSNLAEKYSEKDIGKFMWTQAECIDVNSYRFKRAVEREQFFGGEGVSWAQRTSTNWTSSLSHRL